jgi:hypothetical protein
MTSCHISVVPLFGLNKSALVYALCLILQRMNAIKMVLPKIRLSETAFCFPYIGQMYPFYVQPVVDNEILR